LRRRENPHAFADKTRGREDLQNLAQASRGVAGFLQKFAACRGKPGFFGLDAPGDKFPEMSAQRMAVLANEQNCFVGKNGKQNYRTMVHNNIARDHDVAGFRDAVPAHVEDAAFVNDFASQDFRATFAHAGSAKGQGNCRAGRILRLGRSKRQTRLEAGHWVQDIGKPLLSDPSGGGPVVSRDCSAFCESLYWLWTGARLSERERSGSVSMNTLIVDDEKPARDELAYLLRSFPEVSVVGQGKNGLEAVALIKEHNPDLVFLDVQMPGLDGFGVIQRLMDRKLKLPHIVFATAYDSYAVQAFEVNAVDYILKPFDKQRLSRAIQRAKRVLGAATSPAERLETLVSQLGARSNSPVKLLVKSHGRLFLVDAGDLVCASIEDGIITISTREFEGTSNYRTIEELSEAVASESFWRAHRSHLVNINHIKEVLPWFKSSYMLRMADKRQSEVPVSRAQTKRLRELLKM
jgi:two-component system, LytTR family, response regulator LytT